GIRIVLLFLTCVIDKLMLHSFPTRRSSDLGKDHNFQAGETVEKQLVVINNSRRTLEFRCEWSLGLPRPVAGQKQVSVDTGQKAEDRKSTRLNSSHLGISYAVFCLKKKKTTT